jgi:hypothetical protein
VNWKTKGVTYDVHKYIIGFCGNVYPVIEFRLHVSGGFRTQFFYDAESIKEFMEAKGIKESSKRSYFWREDFHVKSPAGLKNFFDTNRWKDLKKEFHNNKTPVFVLGRLDEKDDRKHALVLNPILKNYQFFKVKDTVTAFQDIYSYISGVLGVEAKPTVKITDKELAKKRGHDGEYSFRKPPKRKK